MQANSNKNEDHNKPIVFCIQTFVKQHFVEIEKEPILCALLDLQLEKHFNYVIQDLLEQSKHQHKPNIERAAAHLIDVVNRSLSSLDDPALKKEHQLALVKLTNALSEEVSQQVVINRTELNQELKNGLIKTAGLRNYDKEEIHALFPDLDKEVDGNALASEQLPCLIWNDSHSELRSLVKVLSDNELITQQSRLQNMLRYGKLPTTPVQWKGSTDVLVLLFEQLWDDKYMLVKCNIGKGNWKCLTNGFSDSAGIPFSAQTDGKLRKRASEIKKQVLKKPDKFRREELLVAKLLAVLDKKG